MGIVSTVESMSLLEKIGLMTTDTVKRESYSQYGEDLHIMRALEGVHGRFLDIGAWSAIDFSNTRLLYENGWSGVMIEPSPEPFLGLLREYGNEPRIQLVCAAVGFDNHCVKIHATADAVSTSDDVSYEKWKNHANFIGSFYIQQLTLDGIFNQFGGGFEFVNIDTEGTSVDVLHALLKTQALPKCICVEHDDRIPEASMDAERMGYRVAHLNGTNLVLAR